MTWSITVVYWVYIKCSPSIVRPDKHYSGYSFLGKEEFSFFHFYYTYNRSELNRANQNIKIFWKCDNSSQTISKLSKMLVLEFRIWARSRQWKNVLKQNIFDSIAVVIFQSDICSCEKFTVPFHSHVRPEFQFSIISNRLNLNQSFRF